MELREWIKFVQVLWIDWLAMIEQHWFVIVEWALVEDVFSHLYCCGKAGLETIPFGWVDAAGVCIGLFVFRLHFLLVSTNWGMSAQKVKESCHACDEDALEAFDWCFG